MPPNDDETDNPSSPSAALTVAPPGQRLFVDCSRTQCPLFFHEDYDVSMFGIERLHPFDSQKWGKVVAQLKEWRLVTDESIVTPLEASYEDLLIAHEKSYLKSLRWPCRVAAVTEVCIAACIPPFLLDQKFLRPMRLQTGGTVAACRAALVHGWAVNVGGGFHHASRAKGGGFCAYADISLAIRVLLDANLVQKVMIVDVDAHQGNGHETDFQNEPRVYIMDVFNPNVYPRDRPARQFIRRPVHIEYQTTDYTYISVTKKELEVALEQFQGCGLIVYNAGTDCLAGDPLGGLRFSEKAIVARDEAVFRAARSRRIPIAMLTSGGYQPNNAAVIANSLRNLHQCELIRLQ